jgi:hypothetical protein
LASFERRFQQAGAAQVVLYGVKRSRSPPNWLVLSVEQTAGLPSISGLISKPVRRQN